jgi:hypothetical protein
MASDPALVVARVVQALEAVKATYWVGGSLASSSYGIPRATQDVDLVADLRQEHVAPFVAALADEFYVDAWVVDARPYPVLYQYQLLRFFPRRTLP